MPSLLERFPRMGQEEGEAEPGGASEEELAAATTVTNRSGATSRIAQLWPGTPYLPWRGHRSSPTNWIVLHRPICPSKSTSRFLTPSGHRMRRSASSA